MKDREEVISKISKGLGRKVVTSCRPRPNRLHMTVGREDVVESVRLVFGDLSGRFVILTGVDTPGGIEVLYHFAFDEVGLVVTLKVLLDQESPSVESITPVVKGAEWIEREIHELLGVEFPGHPNMKRFILAEDWPEGVYPLRRSYRGEET